MIDLIHTHHGVANPIGLPELWPEYMQSNLDRQIFRKKAHVVLIANASEVTNGERLHEVEPEFREVYQKIRATGEPIFLHEHPYCLQVDGIKKEVFLNIVYQPFSHDNNEIIGMIAMCHDITVHVLSHQKLEESERQLRLMADSVVQMIWITDPQGMHEYYNKRWYEFTGGSVEDTAGEGWNKMFHPDDRDLAWKKWRHSLETGEIYEIEYRLLRSDGEWVWVLGRAAPVFNSDGAIVRWFGTCTDIHEQKKLQQQKEQFIRIASHELKTPLTSLDTSLQLLEMEMRKETNLNPVTRRMLELANKNVKKLSGLVNDLLDFATIEKGNLILRKSAFNLSEC